MGLQNWSTTPANNSNAAPNINMATGSAPSTVHPSVRQMMADVANWYADPEWVLQADTPTYTSTTTFTVPGNRTSAYSVGRRIQMAGPGSGTPYTINGTIIASAYGTVTTVTVQWDSGSLDNTVNSVAVGILQNQLSTLLSDLASTTTATLGSTLVGWFKSLANFVGRTLSSKLSDQYSVCDYGAVGDGATDNAAFLANCPATDLLVPPGIYLVNSNTPIAANLRFAAGAILKPASGVTITFSTNFTASNSQIFDLSLGGLISLPYNLSTCWAEWWGAKGDNVKTNNEVPINQALAAMEATASGGTGVAYGTVNLGRGWFLVSGVMNIGNGVSLRGFSRSYTVIKANIATWSGAMMFSAVTGATPIFDSRIENMRIDASQIAAITSVVYTDSWQEKCGLRNVLMQGFMNYGLNYFYGYGGASTLMIEDCEIFPDDTSSNSTGVYATNTSVAGRLLLNITRTVFGTGNSSPTNIAGIHSDNLVDIVYDTVHFEALTNGHLLTGGNTSASGNGVSGGPNMAQMFNCATTWTGAIDVGGVRKGSATSVLVDSNRTYPFAALEPMNGRLQWPPSPTRCLHAALFNGGSSPSVAYQDSVYSATPFASVAHPSAGNYLITLAANMGDLTKMDGVVTCQDNAAPIVYFSVNTTSSFYVVTKNTAGASTDTAQFTVKLYHKN